MYASFQDLTDRSNDQIIDRIDTDHPETGHGGDDQVIDIIDQCVADLMKQYGSDVSVQTIKIIFTQRFAFIFIQIRIISSGPISCQNIDEDRTDQIHRDVQDVVMAEDQNSDL